MFAIDMKPFSTLVLKLFIWVIATTTKICNKGYSFLNYFIRYSQFPLYILLLITPLYLSLSKGDRKVLVKDLKRHPFSGPIHSAGKLLHTSWRISDFRGHRPAVSMNRHPFWVPWIFHFWHLNFSFGSSHIASSAYQIWPTYDLLYLN